MTVASDVIKEDMSGLVMLCWRCVKEEYHLGVSRHQFRNRKYLQKETYHSYM